MTAKEKDELLSLLFAGDKPELMLGKPEHFQGDGLWVAVLRPDGGVAMQALSPRATVLINQYLEGVK